MKIQFLIIIVLAFSLTSQAQLKELFSNQRVELTEWETSMTDEQKKEFIEPLREYKQFEWPFYNSENYENCLNSFHIVDFDQDGKKDIFYSGSNGGESNDITLMRKTESGFEEALSALGSIAYVSKKSSLTPMILAIEQYGCCMEMTNQFEIYHPIWNEGELKYELALKYGYTRESEFPKETIEPIAFATINDEYILRISPVIDDGTSKLEDNRFPGNLLAVYPKGSLGTAIAESVDDTGRTWWFVIMRNNIEPISTILNDGANNSSAYYTMGWMSSRFVERID